MTNTTRQQFIRIRGARQHNLKGIDLDIPRSSLVVVTGPSGSGKSSLAFDTIYAEGQRRYVESLSTHARQFLDLMNKPDVDRIDGLSPALAIDQRAAIRNPRSTVGTVTEIHDFLRLLFARVGQPHCPDCGLPVDRQTVQQMVDTVLAMPERRRLQVLAPLVHAEPGAHEETLERLRSEGYVRVRIDGEVLSLDDGILLTGEAVHSIDAVIDRLVVGPQIARRLADSLETALALSGGAVCLDMMEEGELRFSANFTCTACGRAFEDVEPRLFSFNNPHGACPGCTGLGVHMEVDPDKVVPDGRRSITQGAIGPWGVPSGKRLTSQLEELAAAYRFDPEAPFDSLSAAARKALLWGGKARGHTFEGVIPSLQKRYLEADAEEARGRIEPYMSARTCPDCAGTRLRPDALSVKIDGRSIADMAAVSVSEARRVFQDLELPGPRAVTEPIVQEIHNRLSFLCDVGVDYLTLDRSASALSGGEAQRIRLATQIGSRLSGVLYVLDEPSIGLHPRDNRRLIDTLFGLRDLGNTVIVVEHDRDTMMAADWLIDLGPGAGEEGGRIMAQGTPEEVLREEASLTGAYLSGRRSIPMPPDVREPTGWMKLLKANGHNLQNLDVRIPLSVFVCVTGVSGSGKSSLVNGTLYPVIARRLHGSTLEPLPCGGLDGAEQVDKVIRIDQSPIGRTPRSNAATYTNLFGNIRDLYAQLPESKARGYGPGRFSFNVRGGRCEVCQGDGLRRIEMHFLPDVFVTCDACAGKRYNRETLDIRFKGCTIADVLEMTVASALTFFRDIPQAQRKLRTLSDVGLGYLRLGQPATALSGGEAQRIKLASELSRMDTGKTLYILDEPTTGLHLEDIRVLLNVLDRLVDRGNTVLVIEHNIDVIKRADWMIDLGPEGGGGGGRLVAEGSPEQVAGTPQSHTGRFLKEVLA
jgi:excinuclease ABC subunit A